MSAAQNDSYREQNADPVARAAMRGLMATGHYEETPDAFEWMSMEASDIAYVVQFPDPVGEIFAVLENTGLHDTADPDERECLWRDARLVAEAVGK